MAKVIKISGSEKKKIESILQSQFKSIIKQKGLYDTGEMYNATKVSIRTTGSSNIIIEIETTNYFKYLVDKYKIYDALYNSRGWDEVLEIYAGIISENLIKGFKK